MCQSTPRHGGRGKGYPCPHLGLARGTPIPPPPAPSGPGKRVPCLPLPTPTWAWEGGTYPHPHAPCPHLDMGRGTPTCSSIWTWGRIPPAQTWEGGTPPHLDLGRGYPCPPPPIRRQSSIASTCYPVGGMPLAFTQEDFLVSLKDNKVFISHWSLLLLPTFYSVCEW